MNIDLKADYKQLYLASTQPTIVEVPELAYLMIDGIGEPGSADFDRALKAIYGIAYGIRFALKPAITYSIMPLQARWGTTEADAKAPRGTWQWTLMILQPNLVTPDDLELAIGKVRKNQPDTAASGVRLERFAEGRCAQILHVGPYGDETETIRRLLSFVDEAGYEPSGRHHEIYLSDPDRTPPERLRTIIRYPIAPASVGARHHAAHA